MFQTRSHNGRRRERASARGAEVNERKKIDGRGVTRGKLKVFYD